MTDPHSPEPRIAPDAKFRKWAEPDSGATQLWSIIVDEDWRESFLCQGMYEWAADWLLAQLADAEKLRSLRD